MSIDLYPLMFQPVYKNYPWGGNRIPETYHRNLPPGTYAESWEITDHNDGMSIIENGTYTGESFRPPATSPKMIIGNKTKDDAFPLLIKLIDASKNSAYKFIQTINCRSIWRRAQNRNVVPTR